MPKIFRYMRSARYRLPRLLRLGRILLTRHVTLGNRRYVLLYRNAFNRLALEASAEDYEPLLDRVMRIALANNAGAFIDIGANVGQTLLKLLKIDQARCYVGVEPQLSAAQLVSGFITANALAKHVILPVAFSNATNILKLGTRGENDLTASVDQGYRPDDFYSRYNFVPAIRGDDALGFMQISEVAFVKIDVEGAELEVILGLEETLKRCRPTLTFEILPDVLLATGQELPGAIAAYRAAKHDRIQEILEGLGYKIFQFTPAGLLKKIEGNRMSQVPRLGEARNFLAVVDPSPYSEILAG